MKKGPKFERDVVEFLREVFGDGTIERRVMGGSNDRGDVAGVFHMGRPFVIECKSVRQLRPKQFFDELEAECGNADTDLGAVVFKREGFGRAQMGEQGVLMRLSTLCELIGGRPEDFETIVMGGEKGARDAST